jgi:hypothetical protein
MLPSISMNLVITFGKGILVYHLAAFGPGAVERFSGNGVTEKVDARLISTFKVHLGGVWDGGHFRRHFDSPITYSKVLIIGADKQFQKEVFSLR